VPEYRINGLAAEVNLRDSRMCTTVVAMKDTGAGSVLFDLNNEEWRELSAKIKISISIFVYTYILTKSFLDKQTTLNTHRSYKEWIGYLSICFTP